MKYKVTVDNECRFGFEFDWHRPETRILLNGQQTPFKTKDIPKGQGPSLAAADLLIAWLAKRPDPVVRPTDDYFVELASGR